MVYQVVSELEAFFQDQTDGELRSIITYEGDDVDIVHLRENVRDQYTEEELSGAIDESRMESLYAPVYQHAFSTDHGELQCMATCFEDVVEMNFVLDDGVGVAVALDAEALDDTHGFVSEARDLVVEAQA